MAQKSNPNQQIVFSKERRVFFSKQSLNEQLIKSQKDAGSSKDLDQLVGAIKLTPSIKEIPARTKLPDEVELKFNPKKFTITNPSTKFEFRRTKIQFKLKNFFTESAEILVLFIDKNYVKNTDFIELSELCQYDVGQYVAKQKLGVGKVFPVISKNYENFQGIFIAVVDQNPNRLTIGQVLRNIYEQVQQNDIESIVIPTIKGFKNNEQVANIYIEETVNFLIRTKKPPTQIVITADSNSKFKQLWRLYSDFVQKMGDFDNICLNREKRF